MLLILADLGVAAAAAMVNKEVRFLLLLELLILVVEVEAVELLLV
jgi:hypothetical protein